jgi:hypothetical protein
MAHHFPVDKLSDYLRSAFVINEPITALRPFSIGQSNPTYLVETQSSFKYPPTSRPFSPADLSSESSPMYFHNSHPPILNNHK